MARFRAYIVLKRLRDRSYRPYYGRAASDPAAAAVMIIKFVVILTPATRGCGLHVKIMVIGMMPIRARQDFGESW